MKKTKKTFLGKVTRRKSLSSSKRRRFRGRSKFKRSWSTKKAGAKTIRTLPGKSTGTYSNYGRKPSIDKAKWTLAEVVNTYTMPVHSMPRPTVQIAYDYGTWYAADFANRIDTLYWGKQTTGSQTFNGTDRADWTDDSIFPQSGYQAVVDFQYLHGTNLSFTTTFGSAPRLFVDAFPLETTSPQYSVDYKIVEYSVVANITNTTNFSCKLKMYEYVARCDATAVVDSIDNPLNFAEGCGQSALSAWSTGLTENRRVIFDSAKYQTVTRITSPGVIPYDSRAFTTFFKVTKTFDIDLAPGATHTHTCTAHPNYTLNLFRSNVATGQIAGLTRGLLVTAIGQPVRAGSIATMTALDVITTAPVQLYTTLSTRHKLARAASGGIDTVINKVSFNKFPGIVDNNGSLTGSSQNLANCKAVIDSSFSPTAGTTM